MAVVVVARTRRITSLAVAARRWRRLGWQGGDGVGEGDFKEVVAVAAARRR